MNILIIFILLQCIIFGTFLTFYFIKLGNQCVLAYKKRIISSVSQSDDYSVEHL